MTASSSDSGPQAVRAAVNGWQAEYLDSEYQQYLHDPSAVSPDLRSFFQGFELGSSGASSRSGAASGGPTPIQVATEDLTWAYREFGHLAATLDPLGRPAKRPAGLTLQKHGLTGADLSKLVTTDAIPGKTSVTLRELIDHLERVYCSTMGVEFSYIPVDAEREWFRARMEHGKGAPQFSNQDRALILDQLTCAEAFDKFLSKRYQGKKRFSLEGGESLIPFLKWVAQRAGSLGSQEMILGMAHRGRLSVLKNFLGKDLKRLFTEFEDSWTYGDSEGGGDVKYHRGYSGDQQLPDGGKIHLSMLNNPSHLESVNAVVVGRCRAKQDLIGDHDRRRVISLLIHGDAALAGQGVVAECLTMSQLEGYTVGGTIHVVSNNLIGFTTDPRDSRSTGYCTDIAKMVNAPVIHVNGDDPEAVVAAAMLAADYRHEFRKDVFVDIMCFRRWGHNEQDEPRYTQPALYALIDKHPGTLALYRDKLVAAGVVTADAAKAINDREWDALDAAQQEAKQNPVNPVPEPGRGEWAGFQGEYSFESPKTAVDAALVKSVCEAMGRVPEGFNTHTKLKGLLQARAGLATTKKLSHADGEQLAIGTLVAQGVNVRLSGQDCRRGTFTQRHAVLRDELTGEMYTPVNHVVPDQKGMFSVWDSPLSEYAVMGFDYGYSRGAPKSLVMWEGQFGDFVNGAQIMVDQYLASSEVKWSRWAGLVLLLPHGYEGQGPEHSSARLERFLQLCANDNMEVVYPSTAAQTFHLLRRQVLRNFRKPLIVMTPKKTLRLETSSTDELTVGSFQHVIDDPTLTNDQKKGVSKVIFCSGKVYHELNDRRQAIGRKDIAIVRIEQLYPFHTQAAKSANAAYPASAKRYWVQEEPRNQGAFIYIADIFREKLGLNLEYIGRSPSASPATGSEHAHKDEQDKHVLTPAIGAGPKVADHAHPPAVSSNGAPVANGKLAESKPANRPSGAPAKANK
jgi:2-oxoglutarate dehydrogenase E1 component